MRFQFLEEPIFHDHFLERNHYFYGMDDELDGFFCRFRFFEASG
jgi:hypothetical protein